MPQVRAAWPSGRSGRPAAAGGLGGLGLLTERVRASPAKHCACADCTPGLMAAPVGGVFVLHALRVFICLLRDGVVCCKRCGICPIVFLLALQACLT